jgi:fructokinase
MDNVYAGVEAGGTKFNILIGNNPQDILAETRFPTTSPDETLNETIEFIKQATRGYVLAGVGISCFGPIDVNPGSNTYGFITTTPKRGWANIRVAGTFQDALQVPVAFDTDTNGAAYGESAWGAGVGTDPFLYFTIGTGIGGGGMVNGKPMHGLVHPEMGHVRLPHDFQADPFQGICPYHGDCFEGLANGPAMNARWGQPAETLPDDHPGWELEAHYIALALANFICTISPQRIVLGGGVMQHAGLFPVIRKEVQNLLNEYVHSPIIINEIDRYIVPPVLGTRSGVLGAIAMARQMV